MPSLPIPTLHTLRPPSHYLPQTLPVSCQSLQSIPASFNILFQYNIVFLFFPGIFSHLSNSSHYPNTTAFANLSFLVLNTCPILSNTLFSSFHLTNPTPNQVITSSLFSCLASISFNGSLLPLLQNIRITLTYLPTSVTRDGQYLSTFSSTSELKF